MKTIYLHPYSRQLIIFGRWHLSYAPAYGWIGWLKGYRNDPNKSKRT